MKESEFILVAAPTKAGEQFMLRYLKITRKWTSESVYVIHSKTGNVSFLIN